MMRLTNVSWTLAILVSVGCDPTGPSNRDSDSESPVAAVRSDEQESVASTAAAVIELPLPRSLRYTIPAFNGMSYTETVPDTLDLASMAAKSVIGMTQPIDKNDDYSLYFLADWQHNPPVLRHEEEDNPPVPPYGSGGDMNLGKFLGPLVWNRMVSGSTSFLADNTATLDQVDIMNRYLDRQHESSGLGGSAARTYEGFILNYLRDGNPMWKTFVIQACQNYVEQFQIAGTNDGEEYGYHPTDRSPIGFWGQDPWKDEILLLAYKHLGYSQGLGVVKKHIKWLKDVSGMFGSSNGAFQGIHEDAGVPHFHIHSLYLLVMLEYANITNNTVIREFVKKSYTWAKSTAAGSVAELGYFPEFVGRQQNSEGCAIADMVSLAVKLSKSGYYDYWDDAEKWIRNHFVESQLTLTKGRQMDRYAASNYPLHHVEPYESSVNVSGRTEGAFAGWPSVNDFRHPGQRGIQHCCTGNGARTVYFGWDGVASYTPPHSGSTTGNSLKVNLLMNRGAAEYDVYSSLPYKGQVDIKAKVDLYELQIHMPASITANPTVTIGGTSTTYMWVGRFIKLNMPASGKIASGTTVRVTFPITETAINKTIDGTTYSFVARGDTVVSMSPTGEIAPLYDRAAMRTSTVPTTSVRRFVSSEFAKIGNADRTWKLPIVSTTQSAPQSGYTADRMLDGDQDEESRWAAQGNGAWALFELNKVYTVSYVVGSFYQGDERTQDFEVQVSTDGVHFTTVLTPPYGRSSGYTSSLQGFNVTDARGKWVKLVGRGTSQNDWNEFTEFEIWGTEDEQQVPPVVLTSPSTAVTASGEEGSYYATNTVDAAGTSTRWQKYGNMQWVQYDLGNLRSVASVDLAVYGSTRVQKFDIEVSRDEEHWFAVFAGQSPKSSALLNYDFPNVTARYVRIVCRGSEGSTMNALTDVKVRGY